MIGLAVPARGRFEEQMGGKAAAIDGRVALPPLGAMVLKPAGAQTAER